jgi:hypothetical protein
MSDISSINIEQSIYKRRVIRKYDWVDYLDIVVFCFVISVLLFYAVIGEIQLNVDGILTGFLLYVVAPLFMVFGVYCIYRKIFENNLLCVHTVSGKLGNREGLEKFIKKNNFIISEEADDIVIVIDEDMLSYNGLWRKKYLFLVGSDGIYFNIVKLYPIISPPVLFEHLLLKYDLKRFLFKK